MGATVFVIALLLMFVFVVGAVLLAIARAASENEGSQTENDTAFPRPLDLAQQTNGPTAADEYPFAVIDLETTGFDPRVDRIVEIAVVRLSETGDVWSRWSTLVNPDERSGAEHVHGLTAHDLWGAPTFAEIAEELVHQLSGAIVVAHNASFEDRFLGAEFARIGTVLQPAPALCTLALARKAFPHFPRHTMEVCCEQLDIVNADAHTAGGDADATGQLLVAALRRTTIPRFNSIPWTYEAPLESRARPRGADGELPQLPTQTTGLLPPPPTPWSVGGLAQALRKGGFIAHCPAEGSLPPTHGHLIDPKGTELYLVSWSDSDSADRQCTKIGRLLRESGYSARVNRSDGVCVYVRGWSPRAS